MSDFERAHPRQALADFELGAKLGESAAAEVFRARNRTFGIVVALKRWRRPFAPATQRAFDETCRVHYELSEHPNVVRLLWADLAGDPPWLATELQQGSLAELLRRGPIPPARAWRIAVDVLRALTAVHHRRRPHGALKPANVLVSAEGRAMLRDLAPATSAVPDVGFPVAVPDMQAVGALIAVLFPDPPPAVRALLSRPPRTAEAFLAAVESARGDGREPYVENAGPFRTGPAAQTSRAGAAVGEGSAGAQNTGAYDAPRPAEPSDLPANLHTPAPASRRENARPYPEKSPQTGVGPASGDGAGAAGASASGGGVPRQSGGPGGASGLGGVAVPGDLSAHGDVPAQGDISPQGDNSAQGRAAARGSASGHGGGSGRGGVASPDGVPTQEGATAQRGGSGHGSGSGWAGSPASGAATDAGEAAAWGTPPVGAGSAGTAVEAYRGPEGARRRRRWVRVLVVAAGALVVAALVAVVMAYGKRNERLPGPAPSVEPAPSLVRS
ncbi:protein kinase [Actinoplanes sp. NPDC000266]